MAILTKKHAWIYPEVGDGYRLLVTRYWLRGLKCETVNVWLKELAPSMALLAEHKEFSGQAEDAESLDAYHGIWSDKYRSEMKAQQETIGALARRHKAGEILTLLCACHDPKHCHRTILAELIEDAAMVISEDD